MFVSMCFPCFHGVYMVKIDTPNSNPRSQSTNKPQPEQYTMGRTNTQTRLSTTMTTSNNAKNNSNTCQTNFTLRIDFLFRRYYRAWGVGTRGGGTPRGWAPGGVGPRGGGPPRGWAPEGVGPQWGGHPGGVGTYENTIKTWCFLINKVLIRTL